MDIEIINNDDKSVFNELVSSLRQYNTEALGDEKTKPLSVIIRDDDKNLIGGVSGRTIYKHFLVEVLWVKGSCRNKGTGRKLMELAESEAKKEGVQNSVSA